MQVSPNGALKKPYMFKVPGVYRIEVLVETVAPRFRHPFTQPEGSFRLLEQDLVGVHILHSSILKA